jgi:hypothetical protein
MLYYRVTGIISISISLMFDFLTIFYLIRMYYYICNGLVSLINTVVLICFLCFLILSVLYIIVINISICNYSDVRGSKPKWYVLLRVVGVVLFFLYLILFLIVSNNMVRGSGQYMKLMFPGFMPLLSLCTSQIARFFLSYKRLE